jgi:hypothetical protein
VKNYRFLVLSLLCLYPVRPRKYSDRWFDNADISQTWSYRSGHGDRNSRELSFAGGLMATQARSGVAV